MATPALSTPDRTAAARRLPFTVIDQAVHLLDTPTEPWSIQLEIRLERHLDENRLRVAVSSAAGSHPMARARQAPGSWRDRAWWWEIAPELDVEPLRVVTCPDEAALAVVRNELYSRQLLSLAESHCP